MRDYSTAERAVKSLELTETVVIKFAREKKIAEMAPEPVQSKDTMMKTAVFMLGMVCATMAIGTAAQA